jgi:hypothetical protein
MKKILITLLTLFITLTFSNAIADTNDVDVHHNDEDEDCECYEYKCKVSYFRKEPYKKAKKHTISTQFINNYYCQKGTKVFLKEMKKWLHANTHKEIVGLGSSVQCKSRDGWTWYVYHKCKPDFRNWIAEELIKLYPDRVHINILD